MDENNYFSELEKIANEIMIDENQEPMVDDPKPAIPLEEVESTQGANSEPADPTPAEDLQPASPDETEQLNDAVQSAQEDLEAAQEQLAQAQQNFTEFEKTASVLNDSLPAMGAFAKLIDYSTNQSSDPYLHKIAQERLQKAMSSEQDFFEVLQKTAQELFEDEQNLNDLYTEDGMNYVVETLESFADDEELSKQAFEGGAVIGKAVDTIKEFGSATKNFWQLRKELDVAKQEADRLTEVARQYSDDMYTASDNPETPESRLYEMLATSKEHDDAAAAAVNNSDAIKNKVVMGGIGQASIGSGLAGGALFGGKKIYDATHPPSDEELPVKTAGTNKLFNSNEGGKRKMAQQTVVQDFLKLAGAAALLNIANDEGFEDHIRKEAAEQFNDISRMSRKDMDDSFVKVATELYTEDQLHEIVGGHHNDELFEKVSFFLAANDASADDLEKVAGADGVAAKGVGGALTDAKKEVEEHVKEEKRKAESGNLNPGSTKAQDTSGYNVTNNPQKYKVDKTASMIEQAQLQKQAAIEAFAEAENFLAQYNR